jgi:sulfate/thiosulfate transport system ATP-binding protein
MSIVLDHLTKRYEGHPVVNAVSLEVGDGEFFVLLGPSGSGKSTVLRLIAGLASCDDGRVWLHGRDVTSLPPQRRDIGFVFQQYALFQHMTVAENIAFGLRVRHVGAAERLRRCDELLELVGLAGLGGRLPRQLSGGQQQRVALARALAPRPTVLLLDEPFGALDAKIRIEMRRNLRQIQRELGVTTIFVTHDQEEAFELGDRLGVMNVGRLLEVGAPDELYLRPQTEFAATFLGSANLLLGETTTDGVRLGPLSFHLGTQARPLTEPQRVQVLFRPEDIELASAADDLAGPPLGEGQVEQTTFAGTFERLLVRLPKIPGVRPIAPTVPFGSDHLHIEATRNQEQARRLPLRSGDSVWVGVHRLHALVHPGLSLLLVTDGSAISRAATVLGGQIARLAHARLAIVGARLDDAVLQAEVQAIKEHVVGIPALQTHTIGGSSIQAVREETERQTYDLVILGITPEDDSDLVDQVLEAGDHHVLLVSRSQMPLPTKALICVSGVEASKEDVLFAGRLVRHSALGVAGERRHLGRT